MSTWTVTYDNGEEFLSVTASGKLSLDPTWMFIIDSNRPSPTIVLAIPAWRVISLQEEL